MDIIDKTDIFYDGDEIDTKSLINVYTVYTAIYFRVKIGQN